MANPVESTPYNSLANLQRMNPEISAILPVPPLLVTGGVLQRPRVQQSEKKEYLAKIPSESLQLLHNQYIQTAYLERTQVADEASKAQKRMARLLLALMEKNHSLAIELMQTTRDIITLQNKIVLDEQLDLQTHSLEDFDSLSAEIKNLKNLSDVLDSQRHILKLHKIAPQSGDLFGSLQEIDGIVTELSNKLAAFMQSKVTTTITSLLADGTSYLEDCNDLSIKVERLAIEEMGYEIQTLL